MGTLDKPGTGPRAQGARWSTYAQGEAMWTGITTRFRVGAGLVSHETPADRIVVASDLAHFPSAEGRDIGLH